MVQEIELKMSEKKEVPKITLLKNLNSRTLELSNDGITIGCYDYYSIIEENGNHCTVICWDGEYDLEEVEVYIAKINE